MAYWPMACGQCRRSPEGCERQQALACPGQPGPGYKPPQANARKIGQTCPEIWSVGADRML